MPLNIITYDILLNQLCEDALAEEAYNMFVEMQKNGCKPDVITFGILLHEFYRKKNMDVVARLFGEMVRNNISPDASIGSLMLEIWSKEEGR